MIESELHARDPRRAPCRVVWPGLSSRPFVRVETTVIVLVGTLSIDDVELLIVSISSMHIFVEEIETVGNGSPVGKNLKVRKI